MVANEVGRRAILRLGLGRLSEEEQDRVRHRKREATGADSNEPVEDVRLALCSRHSLERDLLVRRALCDHRLLRYSFRTSSHHRQRRLWTVHLLDDVENRFTTLGGRLVFQVRELRVIRVESGPVLDRTS